MLDAVKIKNRMLLGNIINTLYLLLSTVLLLVEIGMHIWLSGVPRHLTYSGKTYEPDNPMSGYMILADLLGDLVTGVGSLLFFVLVILTVGVFLIFLVIFIISLVFQTKLKKVECSSPAWVSLVKKESIFKCIESGALIALGLYWTVSSEYLVYFCFVILQFAVLIPAILNLRDLSTRAGR